LHQNWRATVPKDASVDSISNDLAIMALVRRLPDQHATVRSNLIIMPSLTADQVSSQVQHTFT